MRVARLRKRVPDKGRGSGDGGQRRSRAGVGLCALNDFEARAGPGKGFWGGGQGGQHHSRAGVGLCALHDFGARAGKDATIVAEKLRGILSW